jgi:transglutaminase-like putative cysteine protease
VHTSSMAFTLKGRFGFLVSALFFLASLGFGTLAYAQFKPNIKLFKSTDTIHVMLDGQYTQVSESLLRAETRKGAEGLGEIKINFNETLETVVIEEAYTLLPDGTRINVPPEKIRKQDAYAGKEYSDSKVLVVIYPQMDEGSMVYIRSRTHQHTPLFPGHFLYSEYFPPERPMDSVVYHITTEPGVNLRFDAEGMEGGPVDLLPTDAPGIKRYRYVFQQIHAYPPEYARVDISDFAPHIAFTTFASYADFAKAYEDRAKPKAAVTPEISALAMQLVSGAKDEREKVRRIYNWVSKNIRYVAVYVGVDGYVPHDAHNVLANRYGDCKDHVVLMESMLEAVGIKSSTALINLGMSFTIPKLPTSTPFNHVITYVPSLDLYMDSTAGFAPLGTLPDDDMAKTVLLTATGEFGRTPGNNPDRDFTFSQTTMEMKKDGSISGTSAVKFGGFHEFDSRSMQFENQGKEQGPIINALFSRFQQTGTGQILKNDPWDLDTPWSVNSTFEIDSMVNTAGAGAMIIPSGLTPGFLKRMANIKTITDRRFPVACSSIRHTELTTLAFPKNMKIQRVPSKIHAKEGAFEYDASYVLNGQILSVTRVFTSRRDKPVCNGKDDKDWNALRTKLQQDFRSQVFFNWR